MKEPEARSGRTALAGSLLAAVLFGLMAFGVKLGATQVGGPFAALVRFGGALACVALLVASGRIRLRPVRKDLLALRGVSGGVAVLLYFVAIDHLGVGLATLLNFTSPVFTALLSRFVLRERLRTLTYVGLGVALAGVALIALGEQGAAALTGETRLAWIGVALLSSLSSGIAVTTIRAARRTDGPWEIFGAFTVAGLLCCAPFSLPPRAWPTPAVWAVLLGVAVVSVVAQVQMTTVLKWIDAPTYGAIAQLSVVVAMALGIGFLDERLAPLSAAGSAVTFAGVLLAARAVPSSALRAQRAR